MAAVRKEISKDDYKFFIGRVEKIGNGQVEFIADTQKKAVELLGEKIPQNVIDAENNYKAFNIWLGNMVNPIIVSDSGYKEESRVFGDGYDFFEVKTETGNTEFKYYLKALRPLFGAVPSGYVHAEKFENAVRIPRQGYVFGTVIYNKPLTDELVRIYDLKPDKNNPQPEDNTAAAVSNAEIIACIDDYAVDADVATDVEIENEINNRLAEEKKRQDFIKSVVNIYGDKKIKLIPQEYYNYGEPETLTARKVAFRSFDYYQMDSGNYNIRIIPQGHEAMSWVAAYKTEAQAQEVIKMLGAAIQRGDETFTFPEVEEVEEEIFTVTTQSGETYDLPNGDVAVHSNKIFDLLNHELASFDTAKDAEKAADELTAAFENGEKSFTFATVEKNPLKEKIQAAELAAENSNAKRHAFLKNFYLKMCGKYYPAEGYVDYVTDYAKIIYRKVGENYVEDATAFAELEEIECNLKAQYREVAKLKNIASKADILKAKIAEQKSRPRKSIIYWSGTFDEMKISEIFTLQKDFKKFLKIGQLELAESIFNQIKILCKNYREAAA